MKWKNKGHEFDELYDNIQKIKKYFLFGAGFFGKKLFELMKSEINIIGFVDNDPEKKGTMLMQIPIYDLESVDITNDTGIIITTSQFTRGSILEQLRESGYVLDRNVFILEKFLSVYYVYRYDKVYFSNISMLPSTLCNLKCECCLNFNPYAKKPDIRKLEQVIKDIDLFFKCVDKVILFHISGGEPFLYPYLADVIEYIHKVYGNKIMTLRTVTNGTVIPSDEICERLSQLDFDITVDDYRDAVPEMKINFQKVISKFDKYNIKYETNKVDTWIDLAPLSTDHGQWNEVELERYFDSCNKAWQELRDGKLFSCNYDGYATVAGINPKQKEEVFDLMEFCNSKKKELVEFRLGYNEKGYTNLCRHCKGFHEDNPIIMPAAKQCT